MCLAPPPVHRPTAAFSRRVGFGGTSGPTAYNGATATMQHAPDRRFCMQTAPQHLVRLSAASHPARTPFMALTDEPVRALAALRAAIGAMRCNKQSRAYYDSVSEQLRELQAALGDSIASMQEAAAFGQTLKQGQLKALQEFTAALASITAALSGAPGTPSSAHGGGSSDGSSAGAAVRPSASGRKPVLPDGVSTLNPDSFFHTRQSLVLALTQLLAAFKGGSPALTGAVSRAKEEVEDIGLFE